MKYLTACYLFVVLLLTGQSGFTNTLENNNTPKNPYTTQYSRTITLTTPFDKHTQVYLSFTNHTDTPNFPLQPKLETALQQRGYQLTPYPNAADLWLQLNIISVESMSPSQIEAIGTSDYGFSPAASPRHAKQQQQVAIVDVQVNENNAPNTDPSQNNPDLLAAETTHISHYFTRVMAIAPETDQPMETHNDALAENLSHGILYVLAGTE